MHKKNLLSEGLTKRKLPTKEMVYGKFMSIQWKIILTTTVFLFCVFSINLGYGIYDLKINYTKDQKMFVKEVQNGLKDILEVESRLLESYISFLSLDSEYNKFSKEKDYKSMSDVIEKYWWELEMDYDATSISFFKGGDLKVHKGYISAPDFLLEKVKKTKKPEWVVHCQDFCSIFKAAPYLSKDSDGDFEILVVSKNLNNVMMNLRKKFDANFIILKDNLISGTESDWPSKFELSSIPMNKEIYQKSISKLINTISLNELKNKGSLEYEIDNTYHFYSVFNVPNSGDNKTNFMILDDVGAQKEKESAIIKKNILLGLLIFIIIEPMLFIIMWLPLKSLKSLSNTLPLIANSDYKKARMNIKSSINKTEFGFKFYYDETDALNINALEVCNQLESYAKELHSRADELGFLAYNDTLTELYNRRKLQEELERQIKIAKRSGSSGAVIIFDLDNFKDVNDGSGHHVGDEMLKQIAKKLKDVCRKNDIISRMGGDEFAIILPNVEESEAIDFSLKICNRISEIEVLGKNTIHKASASVGVAMFPDFADDLDTILHYADMAMYKAKELGRNMVYLFKEDDKNMEKVNQRVYWAEKVKEPMSNGFLKMVYQPIYCYKSKNVSHYEALLRVKDSSEIFVSPYHYISAAEKSGTIHKVDNWVIGEVSKFINFLKLQGVKKKISINLSAISFSNKNLVENIESVFIENDIDPKLIIFEITETAALKNIKETIRLMDDIKNLGCAFALDDFGVGFSSFYNLKRLPVDYVKIDGSFVSNLKIDKGDQVLVESLVYVANAYNKITIAEFVEDEETLNLLENLGVDFAQGYYISKPLDADDVLIMENKNNSLV